MTTLDEIYETLDPDEVGDIYEEENKLLDRIDPNSEEALEHILNGEIE